MRTVFTLGLLFVIGLALAGPAAAGNDNDSKLSRQWASPGPGVERVRVAQSNGMSLSEAIAMVKRQYKGRIVGAETVVKGNREEHRIRVLTEDGKVRTVRVSGRVISRGRG
jgi:uncharacterized protein YoaH (UPF0181 family)